MGNAQSPMLQSCCLNKASRVEDLVVSLDGNITVLKAQPEPIPEASTSMLSELSEADAPDLWQTGHGRSRQDHNPTGVALDVMEFKILGKTRTLSVDAPTRTSTAKSE
mmetsp:Transcript_50608/g.110768  ORF Transcript_50608/g.110768 Transcript_50608/m.110768 type:complete len:108 (+) Transcript_50608:36-359(+)|eukprot:CAMPEP_0204274384 /NCGR_PEP_ID=MMETSP0468-20130131/25158_1 /ASSEMBLY_ACC=CAM_ASM_000383 /TAXON_ID=2969 /ORGANISM="Oxyrrhis marina" /LENGTH=107 /DNA_ID=CAMNT_0051250587 /DNA_START=28 /DNA_END=351 /DNA_ORIENTATION=-